MTDLVAFIEARLTEDEATARAAVLPPDSGRWRSRPDGYGTVAVEDETGETVVYDEGSPSEAQGDHIARHDPARVLREVAAKWAILDDFKGAAEWADTLRREGKSGEAYAARAGTLTGVLRLHASAWSDHPDYRPEWAPESVVPRS